MKLVSNAQLCPKGTARSAPTSRSGAVVPFGKGGSFSSPETYRMSGNAGGLKPGGTIDIGCGPFTKGYAGSLILGMSNTSWSGIKLPLDRSSTD